LRNPFPLKKNSPQLILGRDHEITTFPLLSSSNALLRKNIEKLKNKLVNAKINNFGRP
jgi:hypothetical protein